MAKEEKQRLNQLAGKILREAGFIFEEGKDYDWMNENEFEGYAEYYLAKCWNDSQMVNEADISIYLQLVEIDSILGTTASLQLGACLSWTMRWDIIKVRIHSLNELSKTLQTFRFEDVKEYDCIIKVGWIGFTHMYLQRCMNEETMSADDNLDSQVYTQLIRLDSKLGTTPSEQLLKCLLLTTRWDIIKVISNVLV